MFLIEVLTKNIRLYILIFMVINLHGYKLTWFNNSNIDPNFIKSMKFFNIYSNYVNCFILSNRSIFSSLYKDLF